MPESTTKGLIADQRLIASIAEQHGHVGQAPLAHLTKQTAIGQVLLLDYDTATLAVHDFHKEREGGLARGMFLISGPLPSDEDATLVLMRVVGAKRLANQSSTDDARLTAVRESIGRDLWSDKLATWIADEIALGGVEARILGSMTWSTDGTVEFAEDIANYYSARGGYVWKPTGPLLESIVNLDHRVGSLDLSELGTAADKDIRVKIAETCFAASDRRDGNPVHVPVRIDPTDLLKRRTAFFGMSRSGKSNAMKITAQAVYLLRRVHRKFRVGQLIFDPNGEYAQDNPQDGRGLHRIHELVGQPRLNEVETYGTYTPPSDPDRKLTKINFFGNPIPLHLRRDRKFVESALEQLIVGRELIAEHMSAETTRFTTNFRDADLSIPTNLNDYSVAIRYHRAIVVHQTALAAAGFRSRNLANITNLFGKKLLSALRSSKNTSGNTRQYKRAANVLEKPSPSWDDLKEAFKSLDQFINDKHSCYRSFEDDYASGSSSGEYWADSRLKAVLSIFRTPNGVLTFQILQNQHSSRTTSDYADDIVADLKEGKLVIFDQSIGDPKLNRRAARRIMWKVFREQQQMFTSGTGLSPWKRHVLVYVEEAHNLLPRSGSKDVLSSVWARAAKEGGKMNLGMVLATQAPSSVLPEILSETDNWFISHLNSDNEANVVERYFDFADFIPQIRRVSKPGLIRLRTLSSGYTVPVQLDLFRIPDGPSDLSGDVRTSH